MHVRCSSSVARIMKASLDIKAADQLAAKNVFFHAL
jgi:hypothetical protein